MKDKTLLITERMRLFFLCLVVFSLSFPVFSNAQSTDFGFQSQSGSPFSSTLNAPFQAGAYSPGASYSPFESSNDNPFSGGPVLYGPGGEPIGGLPVNEGYWIISFLVISYAVYKKRRKAVTIVK